MMTDLVGNDIVELSAEGLHPFQREKASGYILNETEKGYYSDRSNDARWLAFLWTCKEATYKILLKKRIKKAFAPRQFTVEVLQYHGSRADVRVSYGGELFYGTTVIARHYIHTLVSTSTKNIKSNIKNTDNWNDLLSGILDGTFSIGKRDGIPYIVDIDGGRQVDVSFSHDGLWRAAAIVMS